MTATKKKSVKWDTQRQQEQPLTKELHDPYFSIEPIMEVISPDRQAKKRWYGTHQYFTRRAWNIVQAYIKNFAPVEGGVVLDPFGGSGITAVEASVLGRKGMAFDINPFAVFYAKCAGYVYDHPLDQTKSELIPKFNEVISEFVEKYPQGDISDEVFFELANQYGIPTKKVLDHRINVETWEMHTPRQLHDLALLKYIIKKSRYSNPQTKNLLMFTLSAVISKCNKTFISAKGRKASRGGARIFSSYAMNLPPNPVELPVFPEFQSKFKKLLQAKQELFIESKERSKFDITIEYCPAQEVGGIVKRESVDYIFTDPPYGKLIPYMDLSSFFCDWLDLKITKEIREKDIIENSSMHRTKEFYYGEMKKSFQQMYDSLKFNRWMTLVYAHKNTEYWDAMISACQDVGFEFVNAVYEKPDVIWSLTKKKNKSTTFSGELYLNFRKINSVKGKLISMFKNDFKSLVRNTVELAIMHNDGCAAFEDIYSEIVPVFVRHGLFGKFKSEKIDLKNYLNEDFNYNEKKDGWELPANRKLSSFIPIEKRVKFYVKDFLIYKKNLGVSVSFDEVISNVLPNLVNGDIPSRDSILDVLKIMAIKDESGNWYLPNLDDDEQIEIPLPVSTCAPKELPKTSIHNLMIWKIMFIGSKASCSPYLGKNEQRDKSLGDSGIPYLNNIPFKIDKETNESRIEQIDCIWTIGGKGIYAFEVEDSTTITSALERFSALMEECPAVTKNRGLMLVIPKTRLKKLISVLTSSTYVGKPLYFENKIRVLFYEDIDEMFNLCKDHYFKLSILEKRARTIEHLIKK